ncbi:MAG: dihydropyrimidinase [Bacteroidales bacterium]|nr:dihydropyrimidinase [Bacteroidales bacterium]
MDILIKQGRIIDPFCDIISDLYISSGKIIEIKNNITPPNKNIHIIHAQDRYIIPGGIDAHVHMHLLTPAGYSSNDFYTGSLAALYGGTTTFIDFVTPAKNESLIEALKKRQNEAANAICNYTFHMSITSWNNHTADEMQTCVEKFGIRSFKTYLAYKGNIGIEYSELEKIMKVAHKLNAIVTVHAEEGDEIIKKQNYFIQQGKTSPEYHALSRPNEVESTAVEKVIALAQKTACKTYIVHTSTHRSVELIRDAQKKGIPIYSETCPQYLILDDSVYQKPLYESLKYIISPPIRGLSDQQGLWEGVADETIAVIATDHCPFNTYGQKDIGKNNFTIIPNGAGGIEHRLALIYTYGVLKNKINLQQWVSLCSTNPAKIFGLYPQKGIITEGADADIVIWNPTFEDIISANTHHQHCDSNIYEGLKTIGKAEYVILNGKIIHESIQNK